MLKDLYKYRFEFFFFSLLAILFGSLLFPVEFFQEKLMPALFLVNIASGILLISKNKKVFWFFIILFIGSLLVFGLSMINKKVNNYLEIRLIFYFIFYSTVTIAIIKQVWHAKKVNKNVIIGLMSGYISLVLLHFLCLLVLNYSTQDPLEENC